MKYMRKFGEILPDYIIEEELDYDVSGPLNFLDYLMIIFYVGCVLFMLAFVIIMIVFAFS